MAAVDHPEIPDAIAVFGMIDDQPLSDDANTIAGRGELSRDGASWEDDLAITDRRER